MILENGMKLLMIGDSITDAGRDKGSNGEGLFNAYGNGYVSLVQALLMARYPELRLRVLNQGNSGNTVRDLEARWEKDVLAHNPDWLSIMIGINDVWRQFDIPLITERQVDLDEYASTLERLVAQTRPLVKGLVLMTPYVIEPNTADWMRSRMDAYGTVVKRLAVQYDCLLVDTQAAFDSYLQHYHSAQLAWDRIHPNMTGHMILARAFVNALGYKWE